MNIYEKIQIVKEKLLKANIKKSGKNKFANYEYYELADFLPYIIQFCNEIKIFTSISFDNGLATLEIINCDEPSERVIYTSPMVELELKGCNKVQALGGTETYSRRYLYMTAFDIIENDMFDGQNGKDDTITTIQETALRSAVKEIDVEKTKSILASFGYSKLSEIKKADYMKIHDALVG